MINNLLESKLLTLQKQWSLWSTSRVRRLWSLCWIRTILVKLYNTSNKKKTNKNKNPVSCHYLTKMLHCFTSKHAAVTWSRRQRNSKTVIQTADVVEGLHNCLEFSQLPRVFRWGYGKTGKKPCIAFTKYFSKIIRQMKLKTNEERLLPDGS